MTEKKKKKKSVHPLPRPNPRQRSSPKPLVISVYTLLLSAAKRVQMRDLPCNKTRGPIVLQCNACVCVILGVPPALLCTI